MRKRTIGIALLGLSLLLFIIYFLKWGENFWAIDSCLDKGGRWNPDTESCKKRFDINEDNYQAYIWTVIHDPDLNKEYLSRGEFMDSIAQVQENFITALNYRGSQCKLEYLGIRSDTLEIKITNDQYLSERIGSFGAECFMSETVFTLLEIEAVNYVDLLLKEGSHASPGIYTKLDFKHLNLSNETK